MNRLRTATRRPRLVIGALAAASATALALTGCTGSGAVGSDDGKLQIVASTNVYGSIAEAIAGDRATVTSIIDDPERDPHEYEADARNQLALSKADIVVENGAGYDDFVDTMLDSADNSSAVVLNVADISGYDQDPAEGEFNEHLWYDYPTISALVDELESALADAEPDAAADFAKNAAAFHSGLDELTATEGALKESAAGRSAAITEPVPLYVLDAVGLANATPEAFSEAIEEGTDVPATVLQDTLALFSEKKIAVLVYNEQTTGAQTEAVLAAAKDADIPVVPVTETMPSGTDYLAWQSGILAALGDALDE